MGRSRKPWSRLRMQAALALALAQGQGLQRGGVVPLARAAAQVALLQLQLLPQQLLLGRPSGRSLMTRPPQWGGTVALGTMRLWQRQ